MFFCFTRFHEHSGSFNGFVICLLSPWWNAQTLKSTYFSDMICLPRVSCRSFGRVFVRLPDRGHSGVGERVCRHHVDKHHRTRGFPHLWGRSAHRPGGQHSGSGPLSTISLEKAHWKTSNHRSLFCRGDLQERHVNVEKSTSCPDWRSLLLLTASLRNVNFCLNV